MKVTLWPVTKPIPYARNPRKNAAAIAKVKASITEFGFRQPVVVDEKGVVIVGHTRLLAAQELGLKEVPVHIADGLTAAQARAYRLADNRTNEDAEWDFPLLAQELEELSREGLDLLLTGFDQSELNEILAKAVKDDPRFTDDVPEVPENPVTKTGDVYKLGRHTLVCGDATNAADWDRLSVDRPAIVFTSPPYGVGDGAKLRDHYVAGQTPRANDSSHSVSHDLRDDSWGNSSQKTRNEQDQKSSALPPSCRITTH